MVDDCESRSLDFRTSRQYETGSLLLLVNISFAVADGISRVNRSPNQSNSKHSFIAPTSILLAADIAECAISGQALTPMLIDIKPLFRYRNYGLLYLSQFVSMLGSMVSYMVTPYQIYALTHSTFLVGLLGIAQLGPILLGGLLGGSFADVVDRKKLLIISELFMTAGVVALAVNAANSSPSVNAIFAFTVLIQVANGFHRPAMDALSQRLIPEKDIPAMSALNSLRYSFGSIVGPTIGGLTIATFGVSAAYLIDAASFGFALTCIALLKNLPP